jgi:NitT/TauT family transport system permease protein
LSEVIKLSFESILLSLISLTRIIIAYIVCLLLSIIISYIAISERKIERIVIAILDVLQSIPVLSFTPAVMMFFYGLGYIGWELATLTLIITGMIWNMIFSFYSSIKNLPEEALELSRSIRLSPVRRFFVLDFPFSFPALAFNSLMSFSGGWYFLMYCEMFSIGDVEIKVRGIGSFILTATEKGDITSAMLGFIAIASTIALSYFMIWRPLIRLSNIFKYEFEYGGTRNELSNYEKTIFLTIEKFIRRFSTSDFPDKISKFVEKTHIKRKTITDIIYFILLASISAIFILLFSRIINLKLEDIGKVIISIFPTLIRVLIGIGISAIVSIPAAIFIGLRRDLTDKLMPAIQILSSLPATALFPIIFFALSKINYGIEINAVIIIALSSIWYIFYNTLSGVSSIPKEILEVSESIKLNMKDKLRKIIIPGAAKDIYVGFLTAWGGAWNGSFVAEFINFGGKEFKLYGIGSIISESAEKGNKDLMIFATFVMASFIALINLLVWRKILEKIEKTK